MQPFIEAKREEIAELCRAHHVRRLFLFGSALGDDFDPQRSDVDLRVEFEALPAVQYAENYFALLHRFRSLFDRNVDLLSTPVIRNQYFRRSVEESQEPLYAA